MSNTSIMSIRDMIDTAFGEADVNIVNFKLIQTVLYLLARQLRILERKVKVAIDIERGLLKTNLSVTEVKIRATVPKKKRRSTKVSGVDTDLSEDGKTKKHLLKTSQSKQLSSSEKSTVEKSSTMKSSSDKTTSEKTKSSTDKTSSETKSSTDKTSSDKTTSEKTKSSTDKTSSGLTESSRDKTSTDKTTSSSKKSSSAKDTSDQSSSDQRKKKDLPHLLDYIEEQREKELRVIHQRADSREVPDKVPTPMVSLDSVEEQYEKLLIVERVPTERARSSIEKRTPQLSIVTQEQFGALANLVRELQSRYADAGIPEFPDNVQLMQELRKGASLTDAMAALQLSARLEAAEKTLKQMMELVTDLVSKSGMEMELTSKETPEDVNILHESTGTAKPHATRSKKSIASKRSKTTSKSDTGAAVKSLAVDSDHENIPSSEPSKVDTMMTPSSVAAPEEEKIVVPVHWVTYDELDKAIQEVTDGLLKTLTSLITQSNISAENAAKTAKKLEEKLESSLNLGSRMNDLELLVSEFSEQVTILDTGLSSQMTNYQEQLTQMQHDLEAGLEAMAEALANTGGDTAAVAELNTHFTNLQINVDNANSRQKEFMESQNNLSQDLQALWRQIEMLREVKSDRDEVTDALRDKAGLGALNGLVTLQQFNAVRGDFEKRIGAAYDKFNNQELTWQKAIDDLLRELNDKADWDQLIALRNDVNKNFEMLRNRIHAMLEVVGEPRTSATTRKLFRNDACLSCSSPAHMDIEEPHVVPKLPAFPGPLTRPPTIGAEDSSKPAEDGDHKVCIPGFAIPHPRDPRSHICHRYCGGSHTLVMDKKSRTPMGMIVTPVLKPVTTGIGSDGKMYMFEETLPAKIPCLPCNEKKLSTPQPSEVEPVIEKHEFGSDMTLMVDFMSGLCSVDEPKADSATPPPPNDDF